VLRHDFQTSFDAPFGSAIEADGTRSVPATFFNVPAEIDSMSHRLTLIAGLIACLASLLTAGCGQKSAASAKKPEPPAKVPNVPKEDKLNEFELTPQAEERLAIATTPVEKRAIARMRMYGAEIVLPTGASLIVTAPLAGFLEAPPKGGIPKTGEPVKKGQPIYLLRPRLSADKDVRPPGEKLSEIQAQIALGQAQTDADGQVKQAQVNVVKAKLDLARAEKLQQNDAGTQRAVDDARAALDLANEVLKAAAARKKLVDGLSIEEAGGAQQALVIEAPQDGIVRTETAVAGEGVPAGAPLFEVMNSRVMWVKVPVYVGELREIAADQPAGISDVQDRIGQGAVSAPPVSAPPTAMPTASTADLYYAIENRDGYFRPGQRVNASLPLREERESLVVPWSAVVVDINGGYWVYENVGEHKFARRRVQVKYVVDSQAVLAAGPAVGAKIVTQGAAELFGTEFFVSK
jgi:RND family efflux transporter MFP subunit